MGFYKGCKQKGWVGYVATFFFFYGRYVTTLTWSKAKNKVIGHLGMTHALASHALMTLNFNYWGISQFTLDFYHKLVLGAEDFSYFFVLTSYSICC